MTFKEMFSLPSYSIALNSRIPLYSPLSYLTNLSRAPFALLISLRFTWYQLPIPDICLLFQLHCRYLRSSASVACVCTDVRHVVAVKFAVFLTASILFIATFHCNSFYLSIDVSRTFNGTWFLKILLAPYFSGFEAKMVIFLISIFQKYICSCLFLCVHYIWNVVLQTNSMSGVGDILSHSKNVFAFAVYIQSKLITVTFPFLSINPT